MIKVSTLEGQNSYGVLQIYLKLLLGLKMLPAYMGEHFEEFYTRVGQMDLKDKETFIREAVAFVTLEPEEIEDLCSWATDQNGVRYCRENMKKMPPNQIHEIMVAVAMQCAQFKINLVSQAEKKN